MVIESRRKLDSSLDALDLDSYLRENGIVILPERLVEDENGPLAAFRPATKELRAVFLEAGLNATLASPAEARKGEYEEHAADWVLPVILAGASVPLTVVANLVSNWIIGKIEGSRRQPLSYRILRRSSLGEWEVIEILSRSQVS